MPLEENQDKNKRLGKGLDALIPVVSEGDQNEEKEGIRKVQIEKIKQNPLQPRKKFDEKALHELSESIRSHGIIQPLVVTKKNDEYELIAGERRLKAAKKAGLSEVPVIVRDAETIKKLELAVIENVQRDNLNPIEEAAAYKMLIRDFSISQDDVAKKVGKSRSAIANKIRLTNLPVEIQKAILSDKISEGHARALLAVENKEKSLELLNEILTKNLTVRETEAKTSQSTKKEGNEASQKQELDPDIEEMESKLRQTVGSRFKIKKKKRGGSLVIDFSNNEEFEKIISYFLNN